MASTSWSEGPGNLPTDLFSLFLFETTTGGITATPFTEMSVTATPHTEVTAPSVSWTEMTL